MTVDRLMRHFKAKEYMELCREINDECILSNMQHKHVSDLLWHEGCLNNQRLIKINK